MKVFFAIVGFAVLCFYIPRVIRFTLEYIRPIICICVAFVAFGIGIFFLQEKINEDYEKTEMPESQTDPQTEPEQMPKETEPKETKPENKYGRYEKMEDGSTQFVYYSHKAMVNDYGYDPCHEQGDIDFEAPDSWFWDDYEEKYYKPGEIVWHENVESSSIQDMGYDFTNKVLYVTFRKNKASYAYYNVTPDVWDDFCCADSYGNYLNTHIKGKYTYERLK